MAGSISFPISPAVLAWARNSSGYSIDDAAKKVGVDPDRYKSWETGENKPTYRQLEELADKVYKRPLAILLLKQPLKEESIQKDFRSLTNVQLEDLSPEIRLALRRAKRYQLILEEVSLQETPSKFKKFKLSISDDPITASTRFRDFIGLTLAEQKSWKPQDAARNFQKKIEGIDIYVFKLKMPMKEVRAFCLTGNYPVIVLNKEDSSNGRIFSLFHEVCHILFNMNNIFKDSENGALNMEYKQIENFCNQFAASFLVPQQSFLQDINQLQINKGSVSDASIRRIANMYNVSNEVIARKLLLEKIITENFFWKRKFYWDDMAKKAKEKEKLKGNEIRINPGITIIFEKGTPYVQSVINAYQNKVISSSDLSNYLETKMSNLQKILDRLIA